MSHTSQAGRSLYLWCADSSYFKYRLESIETISQKWYKIRGKLTLSTSQTLTVLSNEDVARRGMLGLKRTSVIKDECSSRVAFCFRESVYHKTTCITGHKNYDISLSLSRIKEKLFILFFNFLQAGQ